jgi:hypothetical protein
LTRFAATIATRIGATRWRACSDWRTTVTSRNGAMPGIDATTNAAAVGTTSGFCPSSSSTAPAGRKKRDSGTVIASTSTTPRCSARDSPTASPAPAACDISGSSARRIPIPKSSTPNEYMLPSAVAAIASRE